MASTQHINDKSVRAIPPAEGDAAGFRGKNAVAWAIIDATASCPSQIVTRVTLRNNGECGSTVSERHCKASGRSRFVSSKA
ncbi:hypothetical protein CN091_31730 [Sinorhizobium meliloti]|nr:hypothetical protein [Sinorhizobium meliloti]MQW78854.1 hypothetical protein [Sinorhizobium meliloti]RVO69466.1 hypothetical protein CN091_31730 [Sinorhizobium meliloti]RVP31487.1 hypothetical protein CN109_15260 [Sinorhizobium meliloti]